VSTPEVDAETFADQGFVVVRGLVEPGEVASLAEETAAQIAAGAEREPASDFRTAPTDDGTERFFRIQFLPDKALRNASLLLLAAHPGILERVARILGNDWALYGTAMVFKSPEGGPEVPLHRDLGPGLDTFSPEHRFFNVDVYLDAARPGTGCLRVLPRSHAEPRRSGHGLDDPDLVDVEMEPGDVLFHDSLLVHGSPATPPGTPLRRVLYYSFQSADWMLREGVLPGFVPPRRWVAQSMKLVEHAMDQRRASRQPWCATAFPYVVPERWRAEVDAAALDLRPIAGNLPWEGVG
jgi:ectoine hydroxylase-related dioxygenase (phytanoyl-CoA dioxygenase family)